jgi:hypothetical protein
MATTPPGPNATPAEIKAWLTANKYSNDYMMTKWTAYRKPGVQPIPDLSIPEVPWLPSPSKPVTPKPKPPMPDPYRDSTGKIFPTVMVPTPWGDMDYRNAWERGLEGYFNNNNGGGGTTANPFNPRIKWKGEPISYPITMPPRTSELHMAPVNPEFLEWLKKPKPDPNAPLPPGTHGLGSIPSPIYRPEVRDIQMFPELGSNSKTPIPYKTGPGLPKYMPLPGWKPDPKDPSLIGRMVETKTGKLVDGRSVGPGLPPKGWVPNQNVATIKRKQRANKKSTTYKTTTKKSTSVRKSSLKRAQPTQKIKTISGYSLSDKPKKFGVGLLSKPKSVGKKVMSKPVKLNPIKRKQSTNKPTVKRKPTVVKRKPVARKSTAVVRKKPAVVKRVTKKPITKRIVRAKKR